MSMAGDSRGHQNACLGYAQIVPRNDYGGKLTTSSDYQARQGDISGSHQIISKKSFVDKQTGIYARATNKEVVSRGETFKERSTGRIGSKDEHKTISTYRFGDKSGYNEYQLEERFRKVNFDDGQSNRNGGPAAFDGNSSFQHYDTDVNKEINEDEQYEEGDDEEECEDYSDNFEHEENDEDGGYDYAYSDYDNYNSLEYSYSDIDSD